LQAGAHLKHINTLVASKYVGKKGNTEEYNPIFMSCQYDAGKNHSVFGKDVNKTNTKISTAN